MSPADAPKQRPAETRLLVVEGDGRMHHTLRASLVDHLNAGDLLIANDAATIPASLHGVHVNSGASVEVRLAGRRSLRGTDVREFTAFVLGEGDYRTPTEERPAPPVMSPGQALTFGPLRAIVMSQDGHPRRITIRFDGTTSEIWGHIAQLGKPIQYAYVEQQLALWDTWTAVAATAAAFEPPSASFAIDWRFLSALRVRGIGFATLTLAAGISSTGDPALDAALPLDEPYQIPASTARAVQRTKTLGGRVIAVGTTVTRALEHAALGDGTVRSGTGVATLRIGAATELRVVDAILTGVHVPEESHYQLLHAFTSRRVLDYMTTALQKGRYRSHEFGDSVLLLRARTC